MPPARELLPPRPRPWPRLALLASLAAHVVLVLVWHIEGRVPQAPPRPARLVILTPIPSAEPREVRMPFRRRVVEAGRPERRREVPVAPSLPVQAPPPAVVTAQPPLRLPGPAPVVADTASRPAPGVGGLRPNLGGGQLWVRPLPVPPRELARRITKSPAELADSAVTAIVQAYLDSIAAEPGASQAELPSWTTELGGKKYGTDGRNIYIAGLKIPAAVLALIPLPIAGNPTQDAAYRQVQQMRNDMLYAARRSENLDDFKRAIKEIRERRRREYELEKARREAPPRAAADTGAAAGPP